MDNNIIEIFSILIEHKDELGLTLEQIHKLNETNIMDYYIKLLKKLSDNSLEDCLQDT